MSEDEPIKRLLDLVLQRHGELRIECESLRRQLSAALLGGDPHPEHCLCDQCHD